MGVKKKKIFLCGIPAGRSELTPCPAKITWSSLQGLGASSSPEDHGRGLVTLVAITGTTILVPYLLKSSHCKSFEDRAPGPWFNIKMSSYQYRKSIVEIRWSYDRLISPMGFPILVRRYLYIESGPRWLDTMAGYQDSNPSNMAAGRLPHWPVAPKAHLLAIMLNQGLTINPLGPGGFVICFNFWLTIKEINIGYYFLICHKIDGMSWCELWQNRCLICLLFAWVCLLRVWSAPRMLTVSIHIQPLSCRDARRMDPKLKCSSYHSWCI